MKKAVKVSKNIGHTLTGGIFRSPKKGKEDPAAVAARNQQIQQLSDLNEQENYKFKRVLAAQRGTSLFTGAVAGRSAPGNTSGGGGKAAPNFAGMFRGMSRMPLIR